MTPQETSKRSEHLRRMAVDAEMRGDWDDAEHLKAAAGWIDRLEAQIQVYRDVFKNGFVMHIHNTKRRFFGK